MPEEPPDTARVYVPLRESACGVALRLFRDQGGERCAVGFTRLELMARLLGPDQRYYRLTVRSVRELAAQRGVTRLTLDPALVAAPVRELGLEPVLHLPQAADTASAAGPRTRRPLTAMRAAWEQSQAAGILVVSAGAGAAALMLEALK
jgi:hypothetical protein